MKKIILTFMSIGLYSHAFAQAPSVEVKIESLNNTARSTVIEVCGTAKDAQGGFPIVVTVTHDKTLYSTLTSPDGKWCTLIRRWTIEGNVDAFGTRLK